tara:strand:- start:232 stop:372 length:141 start_codon:yes stop_codon:yes gene_type:complete
MHGNLEPEENVFPSEVKWDLEDCKKAYLDSAEEYDRLTKKEEQDDE